MPHEIAELQRHAGATGRFLELQYMPGAGSVWFLNEDVLAGVDSIEDHGIAGGWIDGQEHCFHPIVGQQVLIGPVSMRNSVFPAHSVSALFVQVAQGYDVQKRTGLGRTQAHVSGPSTSHDTKPNGFS